MKTGTGGDDQHLRCAQSGKILLDLAEYYLWHVPYQNGYTHFGKEHAKDSTQPDLKEFYQIGRTLNADHPLQSPFSHNIWPTEVDGFEQDFKNLYLQLERCAVQLLSACSLYLEQPID